MVSEEQERFRSTAAVGLALVCLGLGAPFAVVHLFDGEYLIAAGGLASTTVLGMHAILLQRRSEHARWTLLVMAPLGVAFLVYLLHAYAFMGLLWSFPGILGFYCLLPERVAWAVNATLFALLMWVGQQVLTPDILLRAGSTLLAVNLFAALLLRSVTAQFQILQRRIVTDPLTGLSNRYGLEPALTAHLAAHRRAATAVALLALDVDHFKRVNDDCGHAIGDELLRQLGSVLRNAIRPLDNAFRIGGEEFLVALHDVDAHVAGERAAALRAALNEALSLPGRPVTVSIGVASATGDDTWSSWMSRADDALYSAKAQGRDCVCVAASPPATPVGGVGGASRRAGASVDRQPA